MFPEDEDEPDFTYDLKRSEFEQVCAPLIDRLFPPIEKALEAANYTRNEIDDIVLVGGSSRIPIITTKLEDYFQKPVNLQLRPDEAICEGACIYAGMM